MTSHPQVKWKQRDTFIGLSIEVTEAKKDTVRTVLTETSLHFEVESTSENYAFDLAFSKKIDPEKYDTKVKDRRIKLIIAKHDDCQGEWGRLTPDKPRWLKFDVDSVELTDEETIAARKLEDAKRRLESEHGPLPRDTKIKQMTDMMRGDDLARDLEQAEKELYDMMKNTYLTIYNSVVWLGYFYVFFVSLLRVLIEGMSAVGTNYAVIGWLLKSCQQTVILELVHSAVGLTKSPFLTTFLQTAGRSLLLFCVLDPEPTLQPTLPCYLLVVAWSGIEIIRYPYYVTQLYQMYFPKLTWLRYNAWIPLYPLGMICEALLVYQCIDHVTSSGRLTLELPNQVNVAFNFSKYLILHLGAIILGGIYLMKHMTSQRVRAMRKLRKLEQMKDVHMKAQDLMKIRKRMENRKDQ